MANTLPDQGSTFPLNQPASPLHPTATGNFPDGVRPPSQCCGHFWKWIITYICDPIYKCICYLFCCNNPYSNANSQAVITEEQRRASTPRTPVFLDPPRQISEPLASVSNIVWPTDTSGKAVHIPAPTKELLQFLASSNEGNALLTSIEAAPAQEASTLEANISHESVSVPAAAMASPLASPLRSIQQSREANQKLLRKHLSSIVEKLRNPNPRDPLTKENIADLQHLLGRNCITSINAPTALKLYTKLCTMMKCESLIIDMDPETSLLLQIHLKGPILPQPTTMAAPVSINEAICPTGISSPYQSPFPLNELLSFLASSDIIDTWLNHEIPLPHPEDLNFDDSPLQVKQKYLSKHIPYLEHVQLRNYLGTIINKLRAPNEADPLNADQVNTLAHLIKIHSTRELRTVPELLKFLCLQLKGQADEFNQLLKSYLSTDQEHHAASDEYMAAAEHLALQQGFHETLSLIANSYDWAASLSPRILPPRIVQRIDENDADYLARSINISSDTIIKKKLKKTVRKVITQVEASGGDAASTFRINMNDLRKLICLLDALQYSTATSADIIRALGRIFRVEEEVLIASAIPVIWDEVRSQSLSTSIPLPPPLERIISRPLPNLAATCYLNSVLQMISQLTSFNDMLTHEITFKPSPRRPDDSDRSYQFRYGQELSEFEKTIQQRKALQSHLRAVITMMRQGNATNEPIDRNILETLFKLLQVNGWYKAPFTEQDPHELMSLLYTALGAKPSQIHTVDKLSCVKDGATLEATRNVTTIDDLQIPLPTDEHRNILPELDTMDALIQSYLHDRLVGENGWKPEGETEFYDADKTTYIVEPAPETLFIQQKRFGFEINPETFAGTPYRINDLVPFNPIITIPVYDPNDLNKVPVEHAYKLKVVIGHDPGEYGTSTSVNSGHYTTWVRQKYFITESEQDQNNPDQAIGEYKDTWVVYNDSERARYPSDPPHPESLQLAIRQKGYYLAYVRVPPSELEALAPAHIETEAPIATGT